MFQSLFFWIYLSNFLCFLHQFYLSFVSILVFLDLPFKPLPIILFPVLRSYRSFNPCFSGSTFQTILSSLLTTFWTVSILVFLDLPFKLLWLDSQDVTGTEFQSLFFWIYLSNSYMQTYVRSSVSNVSILVFLDLPFKQ